MLDSGRFEDWTAPRRAAPRGIHLCGLPVVSVTADAVSSTRPWNFVDVATGTQVVRYYHDDIDRSEGRHRFRSRRIEMHFPPVRKE